MGAGPSLLAQPVLGVAHVSLYRLIDFSEAKLMLTKTLELAFHLVAVGGLAFIALLWQSGESKNAVFQTIFVSFSILAIAAALHLAIKMTRRS